jgi:MFS family permease
MITRMIGCHSCLQSFAIRHIPNGPAQLTSHLDDCYTYEVMNTPEPQVVRHSQYGIALAGSVTWHHRCPYELHVWLNDNPKTADCYTKKSGIRYIKAAGMTSVQQRPKEAQPIVRAGIVARGNGAALRVPHQASRGFMPPTARAAAYIFWLLTAVNFLNYLDRIVFVAVGPALKEAFHLNDGQVGVTASAFLLVYTVAALPMGLVADRGSRTKIIAIGVALWSLATWYTAIAHTFAELFVGRAVLGIGEASYIPAGAALLAAYYPAARRAEVLSRWGASTLVGTAVGFIAGGVIAQHIGWRFAFVLCGPPGLLLAWLIWRATDRQAYDEADRRALAAQAPYAPRGAHGLWHALAGMAAQVRAVLRSPTVRLTILLQALGLFVATPSLVFVPIYLKTHFHLGLQTTALVTGGVLIPAGVLGTVAGGWLADRLGRHYAGGRMLAVVIGFAGAAPFFIVGFLSHSLVMLLAFAFVGVFFLNMYSGPLNAIAQDVVPVTLRASALAVIMTLAHLLGDVGSPTLVGSLTDHSRSHNVAHILAYCSGPALIAAMFLALWARRLYAREVGTTASPGK